MRAPTVNYRFLQWQQARVPVSTSGTLKKWVYLLKVKSAPPRAGQSS